MNLAIYHSQIKLYAGQQLSARHEQPQIDDQCDMSDRKFQRPHRLCDWGASYKYIVMNLFINCKFEDFPYFFILPHCAV